MGSGIDVDIDASQEIIDAIEAAAGDDLALLSVGEDIGNVDVVVTFGDGSEYTYTTDVLTASRVMNDHSLYNSLLRSKTVRSQRGRKSLTTKVLRGLAGLG